MGGAEQLAHTPDHCAINHYMTESQLGDIGNCKKSDVTPRVSLKILEKYCKLASISTSLDDGCIQRWMTRVAELGLSGRKKKMQRLAKVVKRK